MLPSNSRQNPVYRDSLERIRPNLAFVGIIFIALIAFEIFNFSTTDHALSDLLGNLTFLGLPWSTVLALAFCGIDFAGIARLFTPEQGMDEPKEVWYLFGAWLLAATMNAMLTWWGVSMAVSNHPVQSSLVVDPETITTIVPVFVAIMVWVIRILIIGTLSLALDRLLHPGAEQHIPLQTALAGHAAHAPASAPINFPSSLGSAAMSQRPSLSRAAAPANRSGRFQTGESADAIHEPAVVERPEPSYHSLSGNGNNANRFRRS